jgi:hypothetical protein
MSLPPDRCVLFFDPGGRPRRRGALLCASSAGIFKTPFDKKKRAQQ